MTIIVKKDTLKDYLYEEFKNSANASTTSQPLDGEETSIPPLTPQPTNEEDEVRLALNRAFSIWSSKLDPQEAASFASVKVDEDLIVHEDVVCDK